MLECRNGLHYTAEFGGADETTIVLEIPFGLLFKRLNSQIYAYVVGMTTNHHIEN